MKYILLFIVLSLARLQAETSLKFIDARTYPKLEVHATSNEYITEVTHSSPELINIEFRLKKDPAQSWDVEITMPHDMALQTGAFEINAPGSPRFILNQNGKAFCQLPGFIEILEYRRKDGVTKSFAVDFEFISSGSTDPILKGHLRYNSNAETAPSLVPSVEISPLIFSIIGIWLLVLLRKKIWMHPGSKPCFG